MSTLKVNTIQNTSAAHSSTPEEIAQGRAKAWVNFDGEGTVAINDSFNVASITDNGTGDYTLNFTNNMSNANYVLCMSGSTNNSYTRAGTQAASNLTTSTARVFTANSGGTSADREYCAVAIFGD
tara:strand:+ start:381 stop:755 length:375 start_codon:yes stop_codon:yes gene_type:complete